MKIGSILLLVALLAACHRASQSNEAIRQGVMDHLAGRSLNLDSMDIRIASVDFHGDTADATVTFTPKGLNVTQGMTLRYQMQQKDGRWEVVKTEDSGHATNLPPGTPNPHEPEGATQSPQGAMPAPEDLPPVKK